MAPVTTPTGDMDDSLLEKREGDIDNENETTTWTEYWLEGGSPEPRCSCCRFLPENF